MSERIWANTTNGLDHAQWVATGAYPELLLQDVEYIRADMDRAEVERLEVRIVELRGAVASVWVHAGPRAPDFSEMVLPLLKEQSE